MIQNLTLEKETNSISHKTIKTSTTSLKTAQLFKKYILFFAKFKKMSHQTGIKCNAELLKFFSKCKESKTRMIKVTIDDREETLSLAAHKEGKRDWQADWDNLILPVCEPEKACFILYKVELKVAEFIFISFIPDTASTRQKMIYSSTKATLKKEFGSSYIKEDYHATQIEEMSLNGYLKNKEFKNAPTPLTSREEEIILMRKSEVKAETGINTRNQAMGAGCQLQVNEELVRAIHDLKKGIFNYLQFVIDLEKEEINISKTASIPVSALSEQMPLDHARFHLYLFKHTYESDYLESYIFVYSMPGNSCSVKERMMYSSCKAPFLDSITSGTMGLTIAKKLEIDDPEELKEENLIDELHPKKLLHKAQFAKPAPPKSNRGPRRLIK